MLDRAADMLDCSRDHIAPVGNRGSPKYQHQFGAQGEQFFNSRRQCSLIMRDAALGNDVSTGWREALLGDMQRFLDHFRSKTRQQRRYNTHALDRERRYPHAPITDSSDRSIAQTGFDPERDDLDGRHHLACDYRLESRKRCKRDSFVHAIDTIDGLAIHHQNACFRGEQIRAPGKGALDVDALTCHRNSDTGGSLIFRNVALVETRNNDFLDARLLQRSNFRKPDHDALFEHQRTLTNGVNRDAAESFIWFNGTEFHAADFVLSGVSAGSRSLAVISAMIATAISDGETAPICNPMGA